jgi:hypothetical protein
VAGASYFVVFVFAGAALVTRLLADASWAVSAVVGALAAAPLLVAYVGERITGFKAFNIEISLAEVVVRAEGDFSGAIMSAVEAADPSSELRDSLHSALRSRTALMQINLVDDAYWWSTRIFLVASLADDYTEVQALVFVRGGEQRLFVGLTTPRALRRRLAIQFPIYEKAYRRARVETLDNPAASGAPIGAEAEIEQIVMWRWSQQFQSNGLESDVKQIVGSEDVASWLGAELDKEPLPYGPLTPLLCFRINERSNRYTALTSEGRLEAVVDRTELAVRRTSFELKQRLE